MLSCCLFDVRAAEGAVACARTNFFLFLFLIKPPSIALYRWRCSDSPVLQVAVNSSGVGGTREEDRGGGEGSWFLEPPAGPVLSTPGQVNQGRVAAVRGPGPPAAAEGFVR